MNLAIISQGGVFPNARNPEEFLKNALAGGQELLDFRRLPDPAYFPLGMSFFYDSDRDAPNRTYGPWGSIIDRRWVAELATSLGISSDSYTASEVFALEAARQALSPLKGRVDPARLDLIVGHTLPDSEGLGFLESALRGRAYKNMPKEKWTAETTLLATLRDYFGIQGLSFFTDAACASSLAALYCASLRLKRGLSEFALVGGVDHSFGPLVNMIFARLGALAEQPLRPFDRAAQGTVVGEASVFFVLTTESRAVQLGLPILGIIAGIDGSSDGRRGGPAEPTVEGQVLAYQRAFAGKRPPQIHYFEGHGTGTVVGDHAEITSLEKFFGMTAPLGTAKGNVGHTLASAGAVGLARCLGILKERVVPPSKYFTSFPKDLNTRLFVNSAPLRLPAVGALEIGLSSFGFGGTNFHLHLRGPDQSRPRAKDASSEMNPPEEEVLFCGSAQILIEEIPVLLPLSSYRIPPTAIPHIDKMILAGFLAAERLFREHGIRVQPEDRKKVSVISAGALALEQVHRLTSRLALERISEKDRPLGLSPADFPEVAEDSATGFFGNLIAGRATKAFDFMGVNFHIDADLGSREVAWGMAKLLARESGSAVLILSVIEIFDPQSREYHRTGMKAEWVATQSFAERNELPILGRVGDFTYES